MKKITLQEIADSLDLSRVTVSKVLNQRPGVAEHTRERVMEALVEHNYKNLGEQLNTNAIRSVPSNYAIFSIAPNFSDFWLTIIRSISEVCESLSHQATYFFLGPSPDQHYNLPNGLKHSELDGIIVINVYDHYLINQITQLGIPAVFLDVPVNRIHDAMPGDVILLDGENVFRKYTQAFVRMGYERLGFIGDITYSQTIHDRWTGFVSGLQRFQMKPNPRYCFTASTPDRYYDYPEIENLFKQASDFPDVLLCANDAIGYHVARRAQTLGLTVGKDLLLTGFDGVAVPHGMVPLTSARIDTKLLGHRLVTQLLFHQLIPDKMREVVKLEPEIDIRDSTGRNFQI